MTGFVIALPKNYLARHWRGELALAVAFWINLVLLAEIALRCDATIALYDAALAMQPSDRHAALEKLLRR